MAHSQRVSVACAIVLSTLVPAGWGEYDTGRDLAAKKRHEVCLVWLDRISGDSEGTLLSIPGGPRTPADAHFSWTEGRAHLMGAVSFSDRGRRVEMVLLITHHFWDDLFLVHVVSSESSAGYMLRGELKDDRLQVFGAVANAPAIGAVKPAISIQASPQKADSWELVITPPGGLLDGSEKLSLSLTRRASPSTPAARGVDDAAPPESSKTGSSTEPCRKREAEALSLVEPLMGRWQGNYTFHETPFNESGVYTATASHRSILRGRHIEFAKTWELRTTSHTRPLADEPVPLARLIASTWVLSFDCNSRRYSLYEVAFIDYGSASLSVPPILYAGSFAKPGVLKLRGTARPSAEARASHKEIAIDLHDPDQLKITYRDDLLEYGDPQDPWREAAVERLGKAR